MGRDFNRSIYKTLVPRMRFKFCLQYGLSYTMTRTQFPLRLAYCMTYNKSQSQTLDRVLLDCTTEPFAHGHLYVALSRVRHYKNIRLFTKKLNLHENPNKQSNKIDSLMPTITNIVHRKVLLHNI